MERRYDAVVVGSGFGGGVTACRLAEAGWRVCVLERGREFSEFPAPGHIGDAPGLLWHRWLNPDGMLDFRSFRDMWVICAAGVGGGSLCYANVLLRAKPDTFAQGWPAGTDRAALDPYYDAVETMLDPQNADPGLAKVQAFAALARLAGLRFDPAPLAVHFGVDRTRFGRHQSGCDNNALCDVGCSRHAKNSIDMTYLARATNAGADIRPRREVVELVPPHYEGGMWTVGFRELERRHPFAHKDSVEAPVVVLAAGSLGSTRLLLKSRRRLPRLSPRLGHRFGGNGDALAVAFDPRHPHVRHPKSPDAPVITGVMDLWDDQRFIVEDGALPRGLVGLLDLVYALGAVRNPKLPLLTLKRLATYLGFSDVSATRRSVTRGRLEKQLRTFRGHSIEDALVFLMVGDEEPNKTMKLTFLRRLDIRQDEESLQNDRLFEAMRRQVKEFVKKSEAEAKWMPIGDFGPLHKFMTVHPLGGCPMADSAAEGVVNQFGAVHGYGDTYGLFVLDGSILPTAAGMNPSMTIAALAERGAGHLRESGPPR